MGAAVKSPFYPHTPSPVWGGLWEHEVKRPPISEGAAWGMLCCCLALGPREEKFGLVSSLPPAEETDKMLSMRQPFRKAPPFKSYHFPCLFHVVRRGWGSSLHVQDLKNNPI